MIKIRRFQLSDMESIRSLQPQGWSDITYFFRFYSAHDFCYPVIALTNGKTAGVANATLNGETGWLAHIIVAEEFRKMNIGYRLTHHVIEFLQNHGCNTILLIATKMGEGLYRKFDFETVSEYLFFGEKRITTDEAHENIRHYKNSDLEAILKMDLKVSAEKRDHMLSCFLSNARVYDSGIRIEGFFLPEFEEGMIIAENNTAGLALLRFKHSLKQARSVLPVENKTATKFLLDHEFEIYSRAARMARGSSINWQPQKIFSRAGGFYG
jgi:GNAT superfamily N-acetyltransferase